MISENCHFDVNNKSEQSMSGIIIFFVELFPERMCHGMLFMSMFLIDCEQSDKTWLYSE